MVQSHKQHSGRRGLSVKQAFRRRGPVEAALDVDLFKALSDPTRARILACLARCSGPCSVGEIGDCCDVDLSVVSRHLGALRDAGLLESTREGRSVRYAVRHEHVVGALRALADAIEGCRPEGGGACCDDGCCG